MEEIVCITKSRVSEIIFKKLTDELIEDGYIYKKTQSSFIKRNSTGFNEITVLINSRWPIFININLIFGIRFDKVEEIRSKFIDNRFGNFTHSDLKNWITVYDLSNFNSKHKEYFKPNLELYYDNYKGFLIVDEFDLKKIIPCLVEEIKIKENQFFDLHRNVNKISGIEKSNFISSYNNNNRIDPAECISILIILKLSKDIEYTNFLKIINDAISQGKVFSNSDTEHRMEALKECIVFLNGL